MKKDYMYKYPSNVVYYSNYPYMDRNSNYNSNDERFAGGFIGPFILGGITINQDHICHHIMVDHTKKVE